MRAASATQSCLTLCEPTDCSPQGSSALGVFKQGYWSELPLPAPGHLPNPGIKPKPPESPALPADSSPLSHQGSPQTLADTTTLSQLTLLLPVAICRILANTECV